MHLKWTLLLLSSLIWPTPVFSKNESTRVYRKSIGVALDKKVLLDIIANFDFSRFETNPNHDLFEIKYSNSLSSNMFGKSATIYLGEKRKNSNINAPLIPRFMYINQNKTTISEEAAAKKILEKKPGFKGQPIEFKTNKHGLKIAIGNFNTVEGKNDSHYLMVLGTPTIVFSEANMIDTESIRFE